MSEYRRYFIPGGTYFFTVVTYERRPILTNSIARPCLSQAIRAVKSKRPFESIAFVLLPDHLHAVWALPRGDSD
jgi:putative transposase